VICRLGASGNHDLMLDQAKRSIDFVTG